MRSARSSRFATIGAASPITEVPPARSCDCPGCGGEGAFRAPRSRERMGDYLWFCLDHVRAYNAAWNYYAGMSDAEVEADRRRDTVWERPTWPLGGRPATFTGAEFRVNDPFGLFGETAFERAPAPVVDAEEAGALAVLDLRPPLTVAIVKARYKELVKRHHPDANGGDKAAEERFKRVHRAYEILMDRLVP